MVATCLDRRCALLPQLRAAELKFTPSANPLQFTYTDENNLKTEQCRLERVEGSEISHTWYVVPDRPALDRRPGGRKIQNHQRRPDAVVRHRYC